MPDTSQLTSKNLELTVFVCTEHKRRFSIHGTGGFWISEPEQVEPTRFGGKRF